MKRQLLILLLICAFTIVNAQINLVINPSFELYYDCPTNWDQIRYAKYWNDIDTVAIYPYGPVCSPEYCNSCAGLNNYIGIPRTGTYYHYPHTGNGMMQMEVYFDNGYTENYQRDYVQGRFYNNLISGKTYCVTFYVTLAQEAQYAINHIGAYIDNGAIDAGQDSVGCASPQTAFVPQIVEDSIINDTLNWHKIQGTYIASGNEKFITIGNFFDIHHTDTIKRQLIYYPWNTANNFAWYLLDDVSVIAIDDTANAGPDRLTSPTADSVWVGDTTGYLPCYWYANGVLIDSNIAGFKVHPDTTTRYVMVLDVCGHVSSDTAVVWVAPVNVLMRECANVLIYPNPAGNIVNIEGAMNCEVEVLDVVGRVELRIMSYELRTAIDISGLEHGVYMVEITDVETGERVVRKLVKGSLSEL